MPRRGCRAAGRAAARSPRRSPARSVRCRVSEGGDTSAPAWPSRIWASVKNSSTVMGMGWSGGAARLPGPARRAPLGAGAALQPSTRRLVLSFEPLDPAAGPVAARPQAILTVTVPVTESAPTEPRGRPGDDRGPGALDRGSRKSPGCRVTAWWTSCHRYWPAAAVSVLDTRTDTTLARLMMTPFSSSWRSYRARVKTRLRRSSSARATASSASRSPAKSSHTTETSSPPTG